MDRREGILPGGWIWRGSLLGLFLMGVVTRGEAHAILLDASPRAGAVLPTSPARLVLHFNGRIVHSLSRAVLIGPHRRELRVQPVASDAPAPDRLVLPLPSLPPGSYAVRWQVLSEDGHLSSGSFSFTVQADP